MGDGPLAVPRWDFRTHRPRTRGTLWYALGDGDGDGDGDGAALVAGRGQPSPWITCAWAAVAGQRRSPRWKNRLLGICISVPSAGPPISCSVV